MDPRYREYKEVVDRILDPYLLTVSSIETAEAVKQLSSSLAKGDEDEIVDFSSSPLRQVQEDIIHAQIAWHRIRSSSHDDPIQDKLVLLLEALWKQLESESEPSDVRRLEAGWGVRKRFGVQMRETWDTFDDMPIFSWTSLNAFVARLTVAEILNFDLYAVWAMRAALEGGMRGGFDNGTTPNRAQVVLEEELDTEELERHLSAASVWIYYAGERLWNLAKQGALLDSTDANVGRPTQQGRRWGGASGYNVPRWNFWKERFDYLAERSDNLNVETKKMIRKARSMMEEISNK